MRKKISGLLAFVMILSSTGVYALKFEPPYTETVSERILETKPNPFSIDTIEKVLIAECDFDDAKDSDVLKTSYSEYEANNGSGWDEQNGYYKIIKEEGTSVQRVSLQYKPDGGLKKGDFYVFCCEIKTEGIKGAAPKTLFEVRSDTKELANAQDWQGTKNYSGNHDWYEMNQILEIPEGARLLNLKVVLSAELSGTVYIDNFKLYKVAIAPLESVLLYPNYKGLIFGDDYCDISVDVMSFERDGFYAREDMSLDITLEDTSGRVIYRAGAEEVSKKMNFTFPSRGLAVGGDYYLKIYLKDAESGEIISKREHTIRKRTERYRPESYVDENGYFIRNRSPYFINKLSRWSSPTGITPTLSETAEFVNEAGISVVSNAGLWWAKTLTPAEQDGLDYMRTNEIQSHIKLSGYWFSDLSSNSASTYIKEQTDIPKFFKRVTDAYEEDPILDGWSLFDEPNPYTVGEEIRWNNEIISEYDIEHPTYGVADKGHDIYGIYAKMCDILAVDPYPIEGNVDVNGVSTDDIAKVGRDVRSIKKNFPNRPVFLGIQGYCKSKRSPNYAELRNMAWQAICEGAIGISWYSYTDMLNDKTKTRAQWETDVTNLTHEIAGYKNAIMSSEPAPLYQVVGGGDWLNILVKRYNGKTYVFAANNTFTQKSAKVRINGVSDEISLTFEPIGVQLIAVNQEDYLSPEAELKSISFSNGATIFAVSQDGGENTLCVPENSGVINYSFKVSDGAELYIGSKKMPEKGKITVKNIDSFEIRIVAEDKITTTTKVYKVKKS